MGNTTMDARRTTKGRDRLRRALFGGLTIVGAGLAFTLLGAHPAAAEEAGTWPPPNLEIPVVDPAILINPQTPEVPPVDPPPVVVAPPVVVPPPPIAGTGRRVVYSNSRQRVWLYEGDGSLTRSYPVSGRRGMPSPGSYSVFSRSPRAYSGSVHMDYMVRFAHGRSKAMGFHAIPVGARGPIQSLGELGQFRSHGCVRQSPADALFMWGFAPLGTRVVVTP